MRLIDADAFKMEDFRRCLDCDSIIQVIKTAPTIAPESLRPTGEWEMGKSGVVYFCSECDMWAFPVEVRKWHYCPNCGAKMAKDGEQA